MAEDLKPIKKQLVIKSGVVKRLVKEVTSYRKEKEENTRKLEKLKAEGADGADIRNAESILKESDKMLPDAEKRLAGSVSDLRDLVNHAKTIPELKEDGDYAKAHEALELAQT